MAGSVRDLLLLVCGTLIFFTYIGFLFLEVGRLPRVYLAAIVRKRILAMAICVAVYTLLGYELANSKSENGVIGFSGSFYEHSISTGCSYNPALVYSQATAALVVIAAMLGSMAVRTRLNSLMVIVGAVSLFIYPVVQFWVWSPLGWLNSKYTGFGGGPLFDTGMLDLGGSAVINLTAGVVAATCSLMVGKRAGVAGVGRKEEEVVSPVNPISTTTAAGFLFVWFGWFGLTGGFDHDNEAMRTHAFLNTLVCPSLSAAFSLLASRCCGVKSSQRGFIRLIETCIFGLAAIAAGAGVMSRFAAAGLGVICAFLYALFVRIWAKVGVDDVTGSVVVHAGGGLVGLVFAALFAPGLQDSRGPLLAAQLVGSLAITGWVAATTFCMCVLVDCVFYLRVPFEEEIGVQSRDLDLVRAYTLPLPEEQDSQDVLRRLTGFMGCLAKKQMERKMLFLLAVLYYKRRVSNMSHHNGRTETHAYLINLARTLYLAYFDQPEQLGLSRTSQMALAKELSKQQRRGLVDLDLAVIFDECALLIESELNPHWLQYQQLLQEYLNRKDPLVAQPKSWLRSRGWFQRLHSHLQRGSEAAAVIPETDSDAPEHGRKHYFYAVDENTFEVVFKTLQHDTLDSLESPRQLSDLSTSSQKSASAPFVQRIADRLRLKTGLTGRNKPKHSPIHFPFGKPSKEFRPAQKQLNKPLKPLDIDPDMDQKSNNGSAEKPNAGGGENLKVPPSLSRLAVRANSAELPVLDLDVANDTSRGGYHHLELGKIVEEMKMIRAQLARLLTEPESRVVEGSGIASPIPQSVLEDLRRGAQKICDREPVNTVNIHATPKMVLHQRTNAAPGGAGGSGGTTDNTSGAPALGSTTGKDLRRVDAIYDVVSSALNPNQQARMSPTPAPRRPVEVKQLAPGAPPWSPPERLRIRRGSEVKSLRDLPSAFKSSGLNEGENQTDDTWTVPSRTDRYMQSQDRPMQRREMNRSVELQSFTRLIRHNNQQHEERRAAESPSSNTPHQSQSFSGRQDWEEEQDAVELSHEVPHRPA
eukprot:g23657.t1